jgi:TonB family protein
MQRPRFSAFAISCALHAVAIAVSLLITSGKPESGKLSPAIAPFDPPLMVWLPSPGPGGGGGGGGNNNPDPPRAVELTGTDKLTMPTAPRPARDAADKPEPQPTQTLNVPAQTFAASDLNALGLIEAGADSWSQGPGSAGGAGSGIGPGIGPGSGTGLGPGNGGNTGGGAYRPGSGVSMPVALHREQPKYTVAAMRARIQGEVIVECVVQPHGECTNVRVLRSLDARLGLDDQALRAAAAWRFSPGTLLGKPVPVLVTIQLGFAIH